MPRLSSFHRVLIGLSLAGVAGACAASIIVDTLPGPNDVTVTEISEASGASRELAVGFSVPTAGYVTHITTSLYASSHAVGPFFVGLASNAIIGQPSPTLLSPPPGSLYEANVCSTVYDPTTLGPACTAKFGFLPNAPTFMLGANDPLDIALNLFLPSGGTYWFYTRFQTDEVVANWVENVSEPSDLIARLQADTCVADSPTCPASQRTFFQVNTLEATPGIEVAFNAVPEPAIGVLFMMGGAALASRRRRPRALTLAA